MKRWAALLALWAACGGLLGCTSDYRAASADSMGRPGYGFNNVNYERLQRGQNPLSYDGTEYQR